MPLGAILNPSKQLCSGELQLAVKLGKGYLLLTYELIDSVLGDWVALLGQECHRLVERYYITFALVEVTTFAPRQKGIESVALLGDDCLQLGPRCYDYLVCHFLAVFLR
jgi:hypothetical protein